MPDFEVPSIYLRKNFDRDDRLAVVLIDRESGEVHQKFAAAEKIGSPPFQAHLRAANASGKDVYISMNTVAPEATGRTKADIETIRHIYLDIDVGGRAAVDKILNAAGMPNPHHILNTSPDKYQVVWRVEGFEKAEAENTLRVLAAQHGADPAVTDCSRAALAGVPELQIRKASLREGHSRPSRGSRLLPEGLPKLRGRTAGSNLG
ncbi:MAG: RepB family DNA primase [Acidobacteriota bacterium]|nr:RepB family DNA primase [Acidobacteriota bacterium]